MDESRPELHRVTAAAVAASFAAVAPTAILGAAAFLDRPAAAAMVIVLSLIYAVPIALLHAFVLGLPLYSLLRWRWRLTAPRAAIGGFAVGSAPWVMLSFAASVPGDSLSAALLLPGIPGAIGGLAFWAMLRPKAWEKGGPFPDRPSDAGAEAAD